MRSSSRAFSVRSHLNARHHGRTRTPPLSHQELSQSSVSAKIALSVRASIIGHTIARRPDMIRKAKAIWRGTGRAGNGNLSTDSGVLANTPYSFRTRFENENGTNPEELIAADMRLMLIVVTVAVAMLLDLRVSQATQMPWCAGTNTGRSFHYNCSLPTYEMCVQEVIAGNRGFCSPNPYYRGPEVVPPRAKRKRYYR